MLLQAVTKEFGALTLDSPELGIVPQKMDAALASHTALSKAV
jgi:hypothetical protein